MLDKNPQQALIFDIPYISLERNKGEKNFKEYNDPTLFRVSVKSHCWADTIIVWFHHNSSFLTVQQNTVFHFSHFSLTKNKKDTICNASECQHYLCDLYDQVRWLIRLRISSLYIVKTKSYLEKNNCLR